MINRNTIKSYGEESAFKRVGWVAVQEDNFNPDLVSIDVVTGLVSRDGAEYGSEKLAGEVGEHVSGYFSEGFHAVTALHVFLSRADGMREQGGINFSASKIDPTNIMHKGAGPYAEDAPVGAARTWADSSEELIAVTKEKLQQNDLEQLYPAVYYNLNARAGHEDYHALYDGINDYSPAELFLPDETMQNETRVQLMYANRLAKELDQIVQEDELMKKRLTVFSDIPASDVPEAFIASRRQVRKHEELLREFKLQLKVQGTSYLPIGYKPAGRTWPYMDATADTEQSAFGRELAALKAGNVSRADLELEREIDETRKRRVFAQHGANVLRLLGEAEEALLGAKV